MKQTPRKNFKIDDKKFNKEVVKKMIKPNYFTDRALQVEFKNTLDSQHINHINSILAINPNFPEIETIKINEILKEMITIYAVLITEYELKYETLISARFDKQDEKGLMQEQTELIIKLGFMRNLTLNDIDNINVRFHLEHQILNQEMRDSGWRLAKIDSLAIYFFNNTGLNGSRYVKLPMRSSTLLNIQCDDNYCSIWSILAHIHPITDSKNGHLT